MPSIFYQRAGLYFTALALVVTLSSCGTLFGRHGYFRDRGDDYVKATEIPPMKVPDQMDSGGISELFVIPPISNEYVDVDKEFEAPRPDFTSSTEQALVKIQKLDKRRWIAMNASLSEVWPRVQHFLEENKIETTLVDPANGEIETTWLMLKEDASARDRYQIKIEPGIHANSCEIHITQVTVASEIPASSHINWPAASVNPEREKWLLDKLASYLTQDDKSGASLVAQSAGGARKVEFVQPYQADPFLVFTLDKERVWASVGGSLNRHPFAIVDADQGKSVYQFTYDPTPIDNEKPGFFCRLFGCDKRAMARREKNLQHYRLQVIVMEASEIKVFIQNENGETLPYRDAQKLLSLIRSQLV